MLLSLRERYLQLLNFEIEHGLFGGVGNGLGPDAFGRQSTRAWTFGRNRAQSPIGIDHHHSGRSCGNRCTVDIVNKAPVTFLPKNTVHTRVMADDDIVIGDGNTRSGLSAYAYVVARGFVAHKRHITDGRVVVSARVGSERFPTDGRVGAAGGIVHERKVTSGSVGTAAVVKHQRVGSSGGVLCAAGVEQKRRSAHGSIGICVVEDQRSTANTSIETAGAIQKERTPTERLYFQRRWSENQAHRILPLS